MMMKNIVLILMLFLTVCLMKAQKSTIYVEGQQMYTAKGIPIVLRGVNYNLLDDGNIKLTSTKETYQKYIDQVALTGANAVRIPWFTDEFKHWRKDYPENGTPQSALEGGQLSNLLEYCHTKGLVPILELHDFTCDNNWLTNMPKIVNWWTQSSVLDLIEKHKEYLIINIANEFGKVRWTTQPSQSLSTFKINYSAIVKNLRNKGVEVPIMIDAPDCGQSSTELIQASADILAADPLKNIIFSAHSYWEGYAKTKQEITKKIDEALNSNAYFMFGEISNRQDVTGNKVDGVYNLDAVYKEILAQSCEKNFGWLAWAFNHDWNTDREMSPTSNINNLTEYGKDLMYNPVYGMVSGNCGSSLNAIEFSKEKISIYPNPVNDFFKVKTNEVIKSIQILDSTGRIVKFYTANFNSISIQDLSIGNYYVIITTDNQIKKESILIKR